MSAEDRVMLKLICLPLKDLAAELGVPYSTVRNWSSGRTDLPEKYHRPLAAIMRKQAKRLEAAASELRAAGAGRPTGGD